MANNNWVDVPLKETGWEDAPLTPAAPGGVSQTQSFVRGAAQGASLGFADELVGGLGAVSRKLAASMGSTPDAGKTLGQLYSEERDDSRQNFKAAETANPGTYLGGNLAGSLATGFIPGAGTFGLGKAAAGIISGAGKVAGISRAVVGAGVNAGAQGAVEAAGSSEGKTAGAILSDAGKGGGIGAGIGGGFGAAGKLLPGVRDSVSNDLWRKVLGVTVGEDAAETATRYLKDPDARNAVVKLATQETVDKVKETVSKQIAKDVEGVRSVAASRGASLLASVDGRMGGQVDLLRASVANTFRPAADSMAGNTGRNMQNLMGEVEALLSGSNQGALRALGDDLGQTLVEAPNANVMREVRDAIKKQLFKQGDPGQGIRDGLSSTESKAMSALLAKTQSLFKALPEARKADRLYSVAAEYAQAVEKRLFKNGKPSAAAVESWVKGHGSAGAVEDKDDIWELRDAAMKALGKEDGFGKGAVAQTRAMQEFNRLGGGDNTGKALAPIMAGGFSMLSGGADAGLVAAFTMAAYNPRMYLRALAKADDLTAEDRRLLMAIARATRLEATKKAGNE